LTPEQVGRFCPGWAEKGNGQHFKDVENPYDKGFKKIGCNNQVSVGLKKNDDNQQNQVKNKYTECHRRIPDITMEEEYIFENCF
jgi:monomeric isocitrate dehydrogenase